MVKWFLWKIEDMAAAAFWSLPSWVLRWHYWRTLRRIR